MLTGKVPFEGPNAFAIMNERLLNNPTPPRELDTSISRQLQEIVYRVLERDPKNRYARAKEMAWDLEHQDEVGVGETPRNDRLETAPLPVAAPHRIRAADLGGEAHVDWGGRHRSTV